MKNMNPNDTYRDEEWLCEQYVEQEKSTFEIGDECGVSNGTIGKWLRKNDIETRSHSEARSVKTSLNDTYQNEAWLTEQYVEQHKSTYEIGDNCGVNRTTIGDWLRKFEIDRDPPGEDTYRNEDWLREQYVEQRKSRQEIADKCGVTRHPIRRWLNNHDIEREMPGEDTYRDEAWLREQYVEQEKTQPKIADECGVDRDVISYWLTKCDIERDTPGENTYRDREWLSEQYVDQRKSTGDIGNDCGVSTVTIRNWLGKFEIEHPGENTYRDETWIREQYVEKQKPTSEIGDECGVDRATISTWLTKFGIEMRTGYPDDHLDHEVDSWWELRVANLLHENGISYENESMTVRYTTVVDWSDGDDSRNTHIHRPDYVTEDYVIEVKGCNWGAEYEHPGTAERKARATMYHLDDREYVVVGIDLPCDHHYSFDDREQLLGLF